MSAGVGIVAATILAAFLLILRRWSWEVEVEVEEIDVSRNYGRRII